MFTISGCNVVVYRAPGPSCPDLREHTRELVRRHSVCDADEAVTWLMYEPSDFDVFYDGLADGDALPTAFAALLHAGPYTQRFLGQFDDFTYTWRCIVERECLLLQVVPKPGTMATRLKHHGLRVM